MGDNVTLAMIQQDPDLNGLDPAFREKMGGLYAACLERGVTMVPICGIRTPQDQAKLYRQSRSSATVMAAAQKLKDQGAPWLASVLIGVGPQKGTLGAHVTKALPGLSWHHFGVAVDSAWMVDGKIEWSTSKVVNGQNGYQMLSHLAHEHGLFSAYAMWGWDYPHVQALDASSPQHKYSMPTIDEMMRRRYG